MDIMKAHDLSREIEENGFQMHVQEALANTGSLKWPLWALSMINTILLTKLHMHAAPYDQERLSTDAVDLWEPLGLM
jgi:hypothetical protein